MRVEKKLCTNSQKMSKTNLKNYRPLSLLPIYSKIFEIPIYNKMFDFFFVKALISANQSGFKPGHS